MHGSREGALWLKDVSLEVLLAIDFQALQGLSVYSWGYPPTEGIETILDNASAFHA